MRSGWSLGSKRKFGREVLPIIGFGIVQILKSTGDTFTIIPWHTGSWIGRWNIATARRTQGSSWTACPQRLKPSLHNRESARVELVPFTFSQQLRPYRKLGQPFLPISNPGG